MDYYRGAKAANTVTSTSQSAFKSAATAWDETYEDMRRAASPAVTSAVEGAQHGWHSIRTAVMGQMKRSASGNTAASDRSIPEVTVPTTGASSSSSTDTRWGRMVSAVVDASNKVSKVVTRDDGYESDQDGYKGVSHLSRIITDYHMHKARSIDDLPDWIRREQQALQPGSSAGGSRAWDKPIQSRSHSTPTPASYGGGGGGRAMHHSSSDTSGRGAGLRDIYDQAAATSSSSQTSQVHNRGGSYSTTNDRLRQLREQKRSRMTDGGGANGPPPPFGRESPSSGRSSHRDDFAARGNGAYDPRAPRGGTGGLQERRGQVYV